MLDKVKFQFMMTFLYCKNTALMWSLSQKRLQYLLPSRRGDSYPDVVGTILRESMERAELRQTALRHHISTDRGCLPREMEKLLKIRQVWINKLWTCLNKGNNLWTNCFRGLKNCFWQKLMCHPWYLYCLSGSKNK